MVYDYEQTSLFNNDKYFWCVTKYLVTLVEKISCNTKHLF